MHSFIAWATGDEASGAAEDDARAEMSLRAIPPPVDRLPDAIASVDGWQEAVRAHLTQMVLVGKGVDGLEDFIGEIERELSKRK
jgi:hypothetical protein